MKYMLFYTGLASTPDSVGLKCLTTGEIICKIETSRPTGKETRRFYNKVVTKLKEKFNSLIN